MDECVVDQRDVAGSDESKRSHKQQDCTTATGRQREFGGRRRTTGTAALLPLGDRTRSFALLRPAVPTAMAQHVTLHGRDAVVVVDADECHRLAGGRSGKLLVDALQASLHRAHWLAHKVRPMFEQRVLEVSEDVMFKWRLLVEDGRKAGHVTRSRSPT